MLNERPEIDPERPVSLFRRLGSVGAGVFAGGPTPVVSFGLTMDTKLALGETVFSQGIHKNTHRFPDSNDTRLQTMIPPSLPEVLNEYTKAIRKARPKTAEDIIEFSAMWFKEQAFFKAQL